MINDVCLCDEHKKLIQESPSGDLLESLSHHAAIKKETEHFIKKIESSPEMNDLMAAFFGPDINEAIETFKRLLIKTNKVINLLKSELNKRIADESILND